MDKNTHLTHMENHYKVKPELIVDCLAEIKQGYAENLDFYQNKMPDPKEYTKTCNDTVKHAQALKQAIDSFHYQISPQISDAMIHQLNIPRREGDQEFLPWLSGILEVLGNTVDGLPLNRHKQDIDGNTELMARKPEFHKDCLVRALARGYLELTNNEADTSVDAEKVTFRDFITDACYHMELDLDGDKLFRRYLNLREHDKLG